MAAPSLEDMRRAKVEARKKLLMEHTQADVAKLYAAAQAKAQEEDLSFGEQLLQEAEARAEKSRKETQQRAEKAKAAQGQAQERDPGLGESANPEPIIQPPTTLQPTRPEAGPTLSPAPVNNYGQPGGPQPGSPGQQGGGQPPLDPYLMQTTVRQGRDQLMPGVLIPNREVTTRIAPNSVRAGDQLLYQAAVQRAQATQAQQAAKGESAALAGLMFAVRQGDKEAEGTLRAHVARLSNDYPPELVRQIVAGAQGEMAKLQLDEAKYQTRSDIQFDRSKALSDIVTSRSFGLQGSADSLARQRELDREARRNADPITEAKRRQAEIELKVADGKPLTPEDQTFLDTRAKLDPMKAFVNRAVSDALGDANPGSPTAPPSAAPTPIGAIDSQEKLDAASAAFTAARGRPAASASELKEFVLGGGK